MEREMGVVCMVWWFPCERVLQSRSAIALHGGSAASRPASPRAPGGPHSAPPAPHPASGRKYHGTRGALKRNIIRGQAPGFRLVVDQKGHGHGHGASDP